MKTTTNTADQNDMARNVLALANEAAKAGTLYADGVQVKAIHRGNAAKVFPPGIRDIVRRYLGVQGVTL